MGGRTERKTEVQSDQQVLIDDLTYEESLGVFVGEGSLSGLGTAGATDSFFTSQGVNASGLVLGLGGLAVTALSKPENLTTFHATLGLFGKSRWSTQADISDSGYQYQDHWLVTKWDRSRYAIGIKELGIYTNEYEDVSEIVSTPYNVPRAIRKLHLVADAYIPREFTEVDPLRAWIEYYVSFGGADTWIPIAPKSSVPVSDGLGKRVPSVINVNSRLPDAERSLVQSWYDSDEEVTTVRVKCRLTRPSGAAYSRFSPVLKGYKLLVFAGKESY